MKVRNFYNKNQFLVEENGKIYFQSYESVVACWDRETRTLTLGEDWDYSNTTRKHLYLFIEDIVSLSELYELNAQKNKRAFIQNLINKNIIKYSTAL